MKSPKVQLNRSELLVQDRLTSIIADIRAGKSVVVELGMAHAIVQATQSLGSDWDVFLKNAPRAVQRARFKPPTARRIGNYLLAEMQKPNRQGLTQSDRMTRLLEDAEIYLVRHEIKVEGSKGEVFIWRTPTEKDFEVARAAVLQTLEVLAQTAQPSTCGTKGTSTGVSLMIRGLERFFDLKISSRINQEAWVGFDFR